MTLPALLIGSVLAALYGALFHFIRGGGFGRLVLFLATSLIAFWVGHVVANILGFTFLSIGPVRAGLASLFSFVGLIAAEWLSAISPETRD